MTLDELLKTFPRDVVERWALTGYRAWLRNRSPKKKTQTLKHLTQEEIEEVKALALKYASLFIR
jgi:hypothetical protein